MKYDIYLNGIQKKFEAAGKKMDPHWRNEILLGLNRGLTENEVDIYARPEYSADQAQTIRVALEEGIPHQYVMEHIANSEFSINEMLQQKKAYYNQIGPEELDILSDTIHKAMNGLERKMEDMQSTYKLAIDEANMQIEEGENEIENLQSEINKSKEIIENQEKVIRRLQKRPENIVSNTQVNLEGKVPLWKRLFAIRGRTEVDKEDNLYEGLIDLICDENLDDEQVEEIEVGWRDGLPIEDIRKYANPENSAKSMRKRRAFLSELRGLPSSLSKPDDEESGQCI